MRAMRRRGWMIDTFLWLCPLAGVGVFVAAVVAAELPPPPGWPNIGRFFDVPGAGWLALLAGMMLLPLAVALVTNRARGFFAGAGLVLLLTMGAGWIRSHRALDFAQSCRVEQGVDRPEVLNWWFTSEGGGVSLVRRQVLGHRMVYYARQYNLSPQRDQGLLFWSRGAERVYPADKDFFAGTPSWLRNLGFASGGMLPPAWNPYQGGITFAVALPYWFLCLLAAPWPLIWMIRQHRRRRQSRRTAAGACLNCGYDLRATPEATGGTLPICPECGVAAGAHHSISQGNAQHKHH